MKYLIVQNWPSTSGNHAGMLHMCKLLNEKYPDEYEIIVNERAKYIKSPHNVFLKFINKIKKSFYLHFVFPKEYLDLCKGMFDKIKRTDSIFLLEYCMPYVPQLSLAQYIKKHYPEVQLNALSHCTPTYFSNPELYPRIVKEWEKPIDKMMTLGSSLSDYFQECGVRKDKLSTGFHYVDSDYYQRNCPCLVSSGNLKVIVMGGMQRNYQLLSNICIAVKDVDWIICRGRQDVDSLFCGIPNITLKGFLAEEELRDLMETADISLNIMNDTVGSNVITTSLSMGLAMVCSDVGSIRDYCDESNALFCENNLQSFVDALTYLCSNKDIVLRMRQSSLAKAKLFSIEKVHAWFNSL